MPKSKGRKPKASNKNQRAKLDLFTVVRAPKTVWVPLDKIEKSPWSLDQQDEIFVGLYCKFLRGKISAYYTRMPISMIKEGFFVPKNNFEYFVPQPPEGVVESLAENIRGGGRPAVHVYKHHNPNEAIPFLCSDDVAAFLAYKRVNISTVPVVVLSSGKEPLPYSSFEIRCSLVGNRSEPQNIAILSEPIGDESSYTLLGRELPDTALAVVDSLEAHVDSTIAKLRAFHRDQQSKMHYHHMLFSALIRAKETLKAIGLLISNNLWYQALAQLRVLYEIHLNFYFDWLQPEINYKYLAAAAAFTQSDLASMKAEKVKELMAKGISSSAAQQQAQATWKLVAVAGNVSEKAKLARVGILYHRDIYDFLSRISHQNFEIASLHANLFEDEKFTLIEDDVKSTYLRFMDLILAEFLLSINGDLSSRDPSGAITPSR